MIYFLINNNFHLIDIQKHIKELSNQSIGLIKIPHTLTIESNYSFDREFEFPPLIRRLKDHFSFLKIFKLHQNIKKSLRDITSSDILIFYTEYEYLNHYVIRLFKKKHAKVILIEEGFPTYISFASTPDSQLSFKKKGLNFFLQYILGYSKTKIVSVNHLPKTQIEDNQIDKLLLYTDIKIKRKVKTGLLSTQNIEFNNLNENTILFLNEALYGHYMPMEEYLLIIDDIFKNLSLYFETIFFKFHPREDEESKKIIRIVLNKYPNVKIINENKPVELMIEEIDAKYVTSFLSQTILYLSNSNCISFYIFNLYPALMEHPEFITVKKIIDEMNYKFMNDWSTVKNGNQGFFKSKSNHTNTLKFYLEQI